MVQNNNREIRSVWSHARIYAFGSIINRAAGFVLIPLYAHLLPASEFGLYAIAVVSTDLAAVLINGVGGIAMVRVYLAAETPAERRLVTSTALVSVLLAGLLGAAVAHVTARYASVLLFKTNAYGDLIEYSSYSSILALLFNLELDFFRAQQRPWAFLLLSTAKTLAVLISSFVLVVHFRLGLTGVITANVASFFALAVCTLMFLLWTNGWRFDPRSARAMLQLGLPLLPARMADLSTELTDKYFINSLISVAAVGQYSLAQRLVSLLQTFISSPFAQVWIVRRLKTLGAAREQATFARIFTLFVAVMAGTGLVLATYAPEIVALISSAQYQPAADLVPVLALAVTIMPLDINFQIGIIRARRTVLLLYVSIIAAVINIVFMYVLVLYSEAFGASCALLLTNLVRVALVAWFCLRSRASDLRFEWGRAVLLLGLAMFCYLFEYLCFGDSVQIVTGIAKFPILGAYAWLAWFVARPVQSASTPPN